MQGYDFLWVDAKGFNLRAGYKFMLNKNSSNKFKGWYLKPEVFFATYTKLIDTVPFLSGLEFDFMKKSSSEDDNPIFYKRMTTFSALANIGYQWVFWKRLTLDVNFGLGVNIWELLIIHIIYFLKDRSSLFKSLKKYATNIQSFFILK